MKSQCRVLLVLGAVLWLAGSVRAVDDLVAVYPNINSTGSGSRPVFTVDAAGNQYISGKFNGTADFNPYAGIDSKTSASSDTFYVTRLNADGTYGWTQTIHLTGVTLTTNEPLAMAVASGTLYVAGNNFGQVRIGAGTSTPTTAANGNSFIAALDVNTGAAVATFGRDLGGGVRNGVQTLNGPMSGGLGIRRYSMAADASGLYIVGTCSGSLIIGAAETTLTHNGAFIAKLSLTTGSVVPAFASSMPLGLTNSSATSVAVSGTSLFVGGELGSSNPQLTSGTTFTQAVTVSTPYALALSATTGAVVTTFDSDGLQILPGADSITGMAADGNTLFACGSYSAGASLGIGTAGTVANYGTTSFYLAKFTPLGAADTAFSGDGIFTAGSVAMEGVSNLALADGVVYAALNISGDMPFEGGTAISNGADVCIVALNTATGLPQNAFSGDGMFPFGGQNFEVRAAVATAGTNVFLLGETQGFGGIQPGAPFLLKIPAATGAVDWVVTSRMNMDATNETLQSAIAKARFGSTVRFDTTVFDLTNSFAATVITVGSPLMPLRDGGVTVDASNQRVTINGTTSTSNSTGNGFTIQSDGNVLKGLSIVGFPGTGVAIVGSGANRAKNNILGGNRSVGTGPNGEGLRIANSGSFGITITASDSNRVEGVWLGLDVGGDASLPNLAGILIGGGSKNNVIGSVIDGKQNAISGNTFEGVTVSEAGSDGTLVLGNMIGTAGVETAESRGVASRADGDRINGRANVANGASGIFLSKGTQNNSVGGTNAGEDNTVGFNGGSGIEVRAIASRKNSSKSNRIARNKNGGIRLFDGSNNNITPPTFDGVDRIPTRFSRAVNASVRVRGSSSSADGSVIEVFRDRGDQGEQIIGRANVANGKWQIEGDLLPDDNVTATVTDPDGNTSAFALFGRVPESVSGTPVITGALVIQATLGIPLNYRIVATASPTDYDALNLPAGLSVNHSTGVISGSPTVTGTFSIDLAATNANGTAAAILSLTVGSLPAGSPAIANPLSATGLTGAPFLYAIGLQAAAGTVTYSASNLPPGLTFDSTTGVISGTPTTAGVYAVPIGAANTFGQSNTTATFSILPGANSTDDSDGDGVSDALELLAQTDPFNSLSKPTVQSTSLTISKTALGLSFTSPKDKLKTTLTSATPGGALASVGVMIGGLLKEVGVDTKGKGWTEGTSVSVKQKNGVATITVSVANVDLEPALKDLGFSNRTTTGKSESLTLPVALRLSADADVIYQGTATLVYKATAGKSGKATQAK